MNFDFMQGALGIVVFLILAWLVSENRRSVCFKMISGGLATQIVLAVVITQVPVVRAGFLWVGRGIMSLRDATTAGTQFVFGYLGGGNIPFDIRDGGSVWIFAFQALPMILVLSALSMLLFHLRILPWIVKIFSVAFQRTLKLGGALGVTSAAQIFLGQTESPLLVRPYLAQLSRSELFAVMATGMATTSATIMALYAEILKQTIPDPITHILTASIIGVPAALTIARIIVPQMGEPTNGDLVVPYHFNNSMEAMAKGTSDGIGLVANIAAMLIVALAFVALVNMVLGAFPVGGEVLTLQGIFGWALSPIVWLMGVPWQDAPVAGNLLGNKAILNEVVAFIGLAQVDGMLAEKSRIIMTYALCGFANLSSIGILIGGLGGMVPERRKEIIDLGFKALIASTLANCMSGAVMGLLS